MGRTEVEASRKYSMRYAVRYAVFGLTSGIFVAAANQAAAAPWELSPNISLSETYLKNDGLALGDQADDDYVTELAPSVGLRREGQRAELDLYYRMQNLWYKESEGLDSTYHQYSGNLKAELVRKAFFVELGATRTQQILDPNNVVSFDNLTTTSNRSDVDTYSVKPLYQQQFSDFANAEVSASYDRVSYAGSDLAGTDNVGYFASLVSGNRFDRVSWAGSFKRIEYLRKDDRDDEFSQTLLLDFGYQVRKRLTAIAGVGYEKSNIQRSAAGQSGGSWKIGARWEPTLRTSVTGTVGQRFYGKSAFFQVSHQRKQNRFQVSYTENITHVSQLVLDSSLFSGTDTSQDDSALVSSGEPVITPIINTPDVTTGLFLSKRWNANFLSRTSRSEIQLQGFVEERELEVGGDSDDIVGSSAAWSWAVGRRTTSTISGDWQRQQLIANGRQDDDIWSASLELSHKIGRSSVGSISARRIKRESPSLPLNYEQDQIGAKLVIGL